MGKKGMGDHAIRGVEDEHGALRIPFVDQVRKLADRHGGEDEAAEDAVLAHGGQGGEEAHPQLANIEYGKPDDTLGFHRSRDQMVRIGLLGQAADTLSMPSALLGRRSTMTEVRFARRKTRASI